MDLVFGKNLQKNLIDMKESTQMIKSQVMVFLHGEMGIYIKVIILTIYGMAMVKCIGQMVVSIKDNG